MVEMGRIDIPSGLKLPKVAPQRTDRHPCLGGDPIHIFAFCPGYRLEALRASRPAEQPFYFLHIESISPLSASAFLTEFPGFPGSCHYLPNCLRDKLARQGVQLPCLRVGCGEILLPKELQNITKVSGIPPVDCLHGLVFWKGLFPLGDMGANGLLQLLSQLREFRDPLHGF